MTWGLEKVTVCEGSASEDSRTAGLRRWEQGVKTSLRFLQKQIFKDEEQGITSEKYRMSGSMKIRRKSADPVGSERCRCREDQHSFLAKQSIF